MKESAYKSYEDLPLFLNAELVAQVLGISQAGAYDLLHSEGFPVLKIGTRMVVPKETVPPVGGGSHEAGKLKTWGTFPGRDVKKRYFTLPNEIFTLGLDQGEIAVYAYLLFCEDRETYQCWPSFKRIGQCTGMSPNTVRKYVHRLEEKRLIDTEKTTVQGGDGRVQNGALLYTIRPIQEAVAYRMERAGLGEPSRQRMR